MKWKCLKGKRPTNEMKMKTKFKSRIHIKAIKMSELLGVKLLSGNAEAIEKLLDQQS